MICEEEEYRRRTSDEIDKTNDILFSPLHSLLESAKRQVEDSDGTPTFALTQEEEDTRDDSFMLEADLALISKLDLETKTLDMYLQHMIRVTIENTKLQQIWTSYERNLIYGNNSYMVARLAILKQACDRTTKQFDLLGKKLARQLETIQQMRNEMELIVSRNNAFIQELPKDSQTCAKYVKIVERFTDLIQKLDRHYLK